ncbi:MAG: hypothetical protein IMY85_08055, partial [Chloroflexi bacterium]|nr:hypothetical protein [Chloroflexota bacterium]
MITKATAKKILGEMPLTAEAYWHFRQGGKPPRTGFKLDQLQVRLPALISQAEQAAQRVSPGKNVLIFCTLHFWISHGTVLGLALAGQGHSVTLAYLPYSNSSEQINKFDLRRQNLYARDVLQEASPLMQFVSFLDKGSPVNGFPDELREKVDQ